jgi:hypothetical protein
VSHDDVTDAEKVATSKDIAEVHWIGDAIQKCNDMALRSSLTFSFPQLRSAFFCRRIVTAGKESIGFGAIGQ